MAQTRPASSICPARDVAADRFGRLRDFDHKPNRRSPPPTALSFKPGGFEW
jgi:hypothetical protein